jgi:hypothetical protein
VTSVKARKYDLRTRVPQATHDQVRRFAAAHQLTVYAAAERLVLLGLDTLSNATTTDDATRQALAHLTGKVDVLSALTDRALFGAMVAYSYARHTVVSSLDAAQRQALDQSLAQSAEAAHRRQRAKVLGGDHDQA